MKQHEYAASPIGFAAALMMSTCIALAAGTHGHVHTEAGLMPPEAAAVSAEFIDREPPLWDGLGTLSYRITTAKPLAQRYFDQGLRLSYAFNHLEAQRAFRHAQKLDPRCAMCFWGEASVLGPNINAPMAEAAVAPAWAAARKAKELARRGSARERALIEALAKRYAGDAKADRQALDKAYAGAMGRLARRHPRDDQIAVLYAESLMNLSPWDYWAEGGRKAKGRTAEILAVLERVLARNPDHPGAIHYYIHMVEASDRPQRAEPYAGRLARLMPGAGHMVHMPGHLYYRLGRYREALEANQAAIAADEAYLKETGAQGIYARAYYPHNVHFLLASAQMAGDGATAFDAAGKLAGVISDETARAVPWAQPIKAAPYFAYAQFGGPDSGWTHADPGAEFPYVQAVWRYARGVTAAARGALQDAQAENEALGHIARTADFTALSAAGVPAPSLVQIAQEVLAARIAQAKGDLQAAAAGLEKAAEIQEKLAYMEPPYWYYPVRRSLAAVRFLAGDLVEAEREFVRALSQAPNDAWALQGLIEVCRKRGNEDAAIAMEQRLATVRSGSGAPVDMNRL